MNSIEWFVNQVEKISNNKTLSKQKSIDLYNKAIEEAKEMHKQEIIDFARHCLNKAKDTDILTAFINTQQYYQETFVSKGNATSDFDKPFMDFAKQYVEQLKTKKD